MGKKQISQLSFFDYVVSISIGSISAQFAVDTSISYEDGITAIIVSALFPILLSYISLKSYICRKLLDGKPVILIDKGEIIENNLRKVRMNVNELLEECRLKDVFDISEIESAVLETGGKLSVLLKAKNLPVTVADMGLKVPQNGLCINVVIDGKILKDLMETAGKDKAWLLAELDKQNTKLQDVLLAYIDSQGKLTIKVRG